MPDALMRRVKTLAAGRKTTFRALVVDALERTLEETPGEFQLEDASVGTPATTQDSVSNQQINEAIEAQPRQSFPS
ncbi:MAG TPA: hypothetical protein VJ952_11270 [Opitutales bacterium]|nr:hypothetical protein [Opitutales bacterium]